MKRFLNWLKQLWLRLWGRSKKEIVKTTERAERHASTQTQQVQGHIRREWTEDEIELLRRSYPHCLNAALAKHLNRSEDSIAKKAQKLGLKKHDGFFAQVARTANVENKRNLSIEQHLASIMEKQKDIGDFSVDLYCNTYAPEEERYVARFKHDVWVTAPYHARCSNFTEALNRIEEYIAAAQ